VRDADKPPKFYSPKTSPFLNSVREAIRVRHLAYSTEQSYVYYITDFIRFHGRKHPRELGLEEVRAYLTDLAVNQNVSASTQNVALFGLAVFVQDGTREPPTREHRGDPGQTNQVLTHSAYPGRGAGHTGPYRWGLSPDFVPALRYRNASDGRIAPAGQGC